MKVCIAEKPSVGREIARILGATAVKEGYMEGNGWQVTWAFGHLCGIKSPQEINPSWKSWSLGSLPMIPKSYDIKVMSDAGCRKQFAIIKQLFKGADEIVNCGDAGQEGELIQRYIQRLAGVRCPVKRLWISSLTEESIREGFKALKPQSDYDRLYEAGLARADGDWLLGMNCTRLYTCKYGGYGTVLSIGRVQTPTLSMVVSRDREIDSFKAEPYWVLTTKFKDAIFTCANGKYTDERKARETLNVIRQHVFRVYDIQQKKGQEQPPQLYDLTLLQVDCNRKFGMSAKQTLDNLQSLYEKKLTTYPRVDTRYLTHDIYPKCKVILRQLYGSKSNYASYAYQDAIRPLLGDKPLPKPSRVFDDSKVTDHHAIIPTGISPSSVSDALTDGERKVYYTVMERFVTVFYPNCVFSQTTVLGNAGETKFKASGRVILEKGWKGQGKRI